MKYSYSILNDTANAVAALDSLDVEIRESVITIALDSLSSHGDTLEIFFKVEISAEEKVLLDAIVSSHNGKPLVNVDVIEMKPLLAEGGKRKSDRGMSFSCAAGATVSADYEITEDLQVKGGVLYTDNNHIMDKVDMEIVDKTYMYAGIMYAAEYADGVPWSAALPNGVPLHSYLKDFPIDKDGKTLVLNDALTTTPLNGLSIRVTYHSKGSLDINCNVGILAYS